MTRIAICDDEKYIVDFIVEAISSSLKKRGITTPVITPFTSSTVLLNFQKQDPFDVLFLDISMPGIDGFKVATEIRKTSPSAIIIFITSKEELVFDSFNFLPFAFIRKDSPALIKLNIDKVIGRMDECIKQTRNIILETEGRPKVVLVKDIMYIKSDRHYIEYHLRDNTVVRKRDVIKSAETEFQDLDFVKIHQRYLVNLLHIKFVDRKAESVILKNGERLEMSRKYKQSADDTFIEYMRKTI